MARHRRRTSFAREVYYIICLVVFIVSALFTLWGPRGFSEMKKAQRALETHRARVNALEASNVQRIQEIKALKTDKQALERYARGSGYVQEGEIIQPLLPDPASGAAKPASPRP